jgi:hypothetical protein
MAGTALRWGKSIRGAANGALKRFQSVGGENEMFRYD